MNSKVDLRRTCTQDTKVVNKYGNIGAGVALW